MQRAQLAEAEVRSLQAENAEQAGQKAELGFEPGHAEEQADIGFTSPTGRNEDMHGPLSAQVSQIMFVTVTIQGRQSLRCNHVLPVLSTHGVSVRPKEKCASRLTRGIWFLYSPGRPHVTCCTDASFCYHHGARLHNQSSAHFQPQSPNL